MQKEQKNQKTGGAACHCLGHFWSLFLPYSFLIKYFQRAAKGSKKCFGSLFITFSDFTSFGFLFLPYKKNNFL